VTLVGLLIIIEVSGKHEFNTKPLDSLELLKYTETIGARGSVVLKELCYKQEGLGLETRSVELISIYLILPADKYD
jgi:hypothetical protein